MPVQCFCVIARVHVRVCAYTFNITWIRGQVGSCLSLTSAEALVCLRVRVHVRVCAYTFYNFGETPESR